MLHPGMELTLAHIRMHLQTMMQGEERVLIEEKEEEAETEAGVEN